MVRPHRVLFQGGTRELGLIDLPPMVAYHRQARKGLIYTETQCQSTARGGQRHLISSVWPAMVRAPLLVVTVQRWVFDALKRRRSSREQAEMHRGKKKQQSN